MKKSQNEHMLKSVPWLQPYWCFCGPKMTKWAHVDLRQQKQRYLRGQRGKVVKKGNVWDVICLRKCGGCSRAEHVPTFAAYTVVFDRFFVASLEPMAMVEAEEAE